MRFDVDWLKDHLERPIEDDELADRLTECGFLVELREDVDGVEVWDVEVTTNRPDAMNHRGLAREASVATGAGLKPLEISLDEVAELSQDLANVDIDVPELCPRYVARIVRGVRVVESPDWLKGRLERCGVRPINAVVDATNYLLLELGQPMHAFDLRRLADRTIRVRLAAEGEELETLDEQKRTLTTHDLVIADSERAVALAGIMGGADTEIDAETTDILIESAHFDALTVRRTARRQGMHTEASHRFERGSDPEMAAVACDAAAAMIAGLTGGRVCMGRIDANPKPFSPTKLSLSIQELSAFAGVEIASSDVIRIFEDLEFDPVADGDLVTVTPPPHRVDIERVPDLYEEVIRHVGYGRVPSQLPSLRTPPGRRNPNWRLVDRGRRAAVAAGLAELMTWSFIDPAEDGLVDELPLCPGEPLVLENPLARTQGTMRRSLLPGLLTASRENTNQGERSLALFEQGRVFAVVDGKPWEGERLGLVVSGSRPDGSSTTFLDLKGIVEAILMRVPFPDVRWHKGGSPLLDEAEGAILTDENGHCVGSVGLLSGDFSQRWDLKQPNYVAELDLTAALAEPPTATFQPLPRYPSVVVDMTVEHSTDLQFTELSEGVRELSSDWVQQVDLQTRYAGDNLPPNVVRTTLRLVYRHPERSLTQDEVNQDQNRLRERLADRLAVRFA